MDFSSISPTQWIFVAIAVVLAIMAYQKVFKSKGWRTFAIIVAVALIVVGFSLQTYVGLPAFLAVSSDMGNGTPQPIPSNGQVNTPTIAVSAVDAGQAGTSVGVTAQLSANGGAFSSTTLGSSTIPVGNVVQLFLTNGTSYHNKMVDPVSVTTTTFPLTVQMNKNASVTETIFSTAKVALTNNGGTSNQTDSGNGASYNLIDDMTGTSLASTQDMTCVIEITAGNNASTTPSGATLSLGGSPIALKSTSKPIWYATSSTNSNVYLFDIPALNSASMVEYTIGLNAKSNGRFNAGTSMIKTCYTKENFIDPVTGKPSYDVADSNGLLKSMASYKYTVYFQ